MLYVEIGFTIRKNKNDLADDIVEYENKNDI